jgi:hypothetical protein
MKLKQYVVSLICGVVLFSSASVRAADAKGYQVTGPVLELTPTTIVVQKGQDKWEIARNSKTKVTGELKVGAKVTVYYTMTATDIDVKPGKEAKDKK